MYISGRLNYNTGYLIESIPNQINLEGNPIQMMDHFTLTALTSLSSLTILNLGDTELTELPENLLKGK